MAAGLMSLPPQQQRQPQWRWHWRLRPEACARLWRGRRRGIVALWAVAVAAAAVVAATRTAMETKGGKEPRRVVEPLMRTGRTPLLVKKRERWWFPPSGGEWPWRWTTERRVASLSDLLPCEDKCAKGPFAIQKHETKRACSNELKMQRAKCRWACGASTDAKAESVEDALLALHPTCVRNSTFRTQYQSVKDATACRACLGATPPHDDERRAVCGTATHEFPRVEVPAGFPAWLSLKDIPGGSRILFMGDSTMEAMHAQAVCGMSSLATARPLPGSRSYVDFPSWNVVCHDPSTTDLETFTAMSTRAFSVRGGDATSSEGVVQLDFVFSFRIPANDPEALRIMCEHYDVVLFNWGLHYPLEWRLYEAHWGAAAHALANCSAVKLWLSHPAQHFGGAFGWWQPQFMSRHPACVPLSRTFPHDRFPNASSVVELADVDMRTHVARRVLHRAGVRVVPPWYLWPPTPAGLAGVAARPSDVHFVPHFDFTAELHAFHPKASDCTHYKPEPAVYALVWHALARFARMRVGMGGAGVVDVADAKEDEDALWRAAQQPRNKQRPPAFTALVQRFERGGKAAADACAARVAVAAAARAALKPGTWMDLATDFASQSQAAAAAAAAAGPLHHVVVDDVELEKLS